MRNETIIYVLAATSSLENVLYWNGCYWTRKFASGKIFKDFRSILKIKQREIDRMNERLNDPFFSLGGDKMIDFAKHIKNEHLIVKDIRIEAFDLLPLGEKTDEDINDL